MFKLFAHLINNVKPVFKLSILVFWNVRLGYYFSNTRFSIFRFIQFYPLAIFTDYSMNKDITSSAYQWPSRITGTHPHHLICRRSSVCSWTCLFNRTVRPPPRGCSFFFFLFGFFGLTKTAINVWKYSFPLLFPTHSRNTLLPRLPFLLTISLIQLTSFLF